MAHMVVAVRSMMVHDNWNQEILSLTNVDTACQGDRSPQSSDSFHHEARNTMGNTIEQNTPKFMLFSSGARTHDRSRMKRSFRPLTVKQKFGAQLIEDRYVFIMNNFRKMRSEFSRL